MVPPAWEFVHAQRPAQSRDCYTFRSGGRELPVLQTTGPCLGPGPQLKETGGGRNGLLATRTTCSDDSCLCTSNFQVYRPGREGGEPLDWDFHDGLTVGGLGASCGGGGGESVCR